MQWPKQKALTLSASLINLATMDLFVCRRILHYRDYVMRRVSGVFDRRYEHTQSRFWQRIFFSHAGMGNSTTGTLKSYLVIPWHYGEDNCCGMVIADCNAETCTSKTKIFLIPSRLSAVSASTKENHFSFLHKKISIFVQHYPSRLPSLLQTVEILLLSVRHSTLCPKFPMKSGPLEHRQ